MLLSPDRPYNQTQKKKHEHEAADTTCDISVSHVECDVVPEWDAAFYHGRFPPWSRLQDISGRTYDCRNSGICTSRDGTACLYGPQ